MSLLNFQTVDPFAEAGESVDQKANFIHIRVQQRNNRKRLTTVQGLPEPYKPLVVLKRLRKLLSCNGCIVQDDKWGDVIQLQGDQRHAVAAILKAKGMGTSENIHIHGS